MAWEEQKCVSFPESCLEAGNSRLGRSSQTFRVWLIYVLCCLEAKIDDENLGQTKLNAKQKQK